MHDIKKILCHIIDEKTLKMLNDTKYDFPNKRLIIHPLSIFEKETGLTYNIGDLGQCVISLDDIAIYVKQDLSDELFNIVLSHELLHHYQYMNCINVIFDVNHFCKKKLNDIHRIIKNITNSMMDIEVFYKQKLLGYDLTSFLKFLIDSHIKDLSNTEVNINLPNNISWYFMEFYKCWFISEYLYALNNLKFKNNILNFYVNNLCDNNWTIWKSLLLLTKKYPPDSRHNYDLMLKQICLRLLRCTAYLKKIKPPQRKINLILSELIPSCASEDYAPTCPRGHHTQSK